MTSSTTASFRLDAAPVVRARFYRVLALAVAATRSPSGVVFESNPLAGAAWVTVRPGSLVATVRASIDPTFPSVEERAVPPPFGPPAGSPGRYGVLVPVPSGSWGGTGRPPGPDGAPDWAALVGPHGWLGVQTFWVRSPSAGLWVARRVRFAVGSGEELVRRAEALAPALAAEWGARLGVPAELRPVRGGGRAWRRGTSAGMTPRAWILRTPDGAAATAELSADPSPGPPAPASAVGPTIVFGATGAGKTAHLADRAAVAIGRGERVVAIDLHGDLAPALLARLGARARERVIAVDASDRPVPGIAALDPHGGDGEREAAHVVAALKRLTPDGTDLYWGFRLERIFDTFVRLVQESHGTLVDLFGLLTSADRRDAARLATRVPALAGFLDELAPVVRRNPEFLWSAATRLSKVVLVPALGELLAPADGGLPIEARIADGDSLVVRLPFATLGPEAAQFAGTLLLSRLYLGLAAVAAGSPRACPVLLVLDEVHGFSPRLVAELLTEGRKFGLTPLVATQYPDRLAPEVRSAAAGSFAGFVAFRLPAPTARDVAPWLGVTVAEAEAVLPALPAGHGLTVTAGGSTAGLWVPPSRPVPEDPGAWTASVARTRMRFGVVPGTLDPAGETDALDERLLLAVLAADEIGRPLAEAAVVGAATELPGPGADPALLADRWSTLRRHDVAVHGPTGWHLTPAGERRLGIGAPTGATRESAEHRALLLRAFRVFARHGCRLEIVRQGRYDTSLPDGRFCQIPVDRRQDPPGVLADALRAASAGWAWRCFRGRDVFVEAEVSGALRPERIRHGVAKARAHGAFVVFVVGDAVRARRARDALKGAGVGPDRAQVWTLPTGLARPGAHR